MVKYVERDLETRYQQLNIMGEDLLHLDFLPYACLYFSSSFQGYLFWFNWWKHGILMPSSLTANMGIRFCGICSKQTFGLGLKCSMKGFVDATVLGLVWSKSTEEDDAGVV